MEAPTSTNYTFFLLYVNYVNYRSVTDHRVFNKLSDNDDDVELPKSIFILAKISNGFTKPIIFSFLTQKSFQTVTLSIFCQIFSRFQNKEKTFLITGSTVELEIKM